MKSLVIDLYCGAGGAAKGYADAGFDVLGIDLHDQPKYPYSFYQGDALEFLEDLAAGWVSPVFRDNIAFVHASPPCQRYSKASACRPGLAEKYPDLLDPTRQLLRKAGYPYVLENVPGAPMENPVELCGCNFTESTTTWEPYGLVQLRRPRLFEASFPLGISYSHWHKLPCVTVAGHAPSKGATCKGPGYAKASREVMNIDWMNREEMAEAIPPYMTRYIGGWYKKWEKENSSTSGQI